MILTKNEIREINLDKLINSKINSEALNEILFIVPTNRKIRYLKRELISASPNKASANINLETLGTYSTRLLTGYDGNENIISEESAIIILKQSFQETKLKYFSNYKGVIPFGTLERVKNVISEYKRHGITPEKLSEESENLTGMEKIKAKDISKIYFIYQEKYNELGVKEIGDIYADICKMHNKIFFEKFFESFPKVQLILISGFDEFTVPEIEIINKSADLVDVELYLNFDYFKFNPAIFSHLDACYYKLEGKGFKTVGDLSESVQSKFLIEAKQNLFSSKSKKQSSDYKKKITELSAFNREQEVGLIAKELKKLVIEKKVRPDQICIAFNLIKPYSPIVRDQLSTYGIPFNLTDRLTLNTSPPVITIINLLEIVENDFYYKNIFRTLSNNAIDSIKIDLHNLLLASIDLKVISGLRNWKNSLNDAIVESKMVGDEEDLKRYNVDYKKALADIDSIHSFLTSFERGMTPDQFYNSVRNLIFKLKIHINVLNKNNESVERDVKALSTFLKSLKELTSLLAAEYGKDKQLTLKYYLNHLKTLASFSRYNVKEKPGYGVQVTTLNEIRGLHFDYLFIAGLTDGDFPTRYSPEIFFSGSFAREENRYQTEERYHFYQALCSWREGLYLTHPLTDERKELVESSFLKEFKNCFEINLKSETDYDDAIYSKIDLLSFVGKNIDPADDQDFSFALHELNLNEIKNAVMINDIHIKESFGNSEYTGILTNKLNEESRQTLSELREKQFSITQLESYAKCPFQYFADRVLHLNTIEEPTEELEAFELGSLLHGILYEFYKSLKEKKIILQGASDKDFSKAENILFEIASNGIEKLKLKSSLSFFEREKIFGIEGDKKNSILYKFLKTERDLKEGFIPEFFEFKFGDDRNSFDGQPYPEKEFLIDDIRVGGKIDRIDVNDKEKIIKVVDYKLSGKKPSQKELLTGLSLQLPLYLYAAKELIKTQLDKDYETFGAEIYSLKFNENDFGPKLVKTSSKRSMTKDDSVLMAEEMIQICLDAINKYVNEIIKGKFNLSELEERESKVCRYCNFRSICRIQEIN